MKNTYNLKELIEYPKSGILSKEIVKSKKADITLFCMAKESEMSEHTSTRKALIQVIEGDGVFNLKRKKIKMNSGTIILMKENEKHSLKANKNTSFILTLI